MAAMVASQLTKSAVCHWLPGWHHSLWLCCGVARMASQLVGCAKLCRVVAMMASQLVGCVVAMMASQLVVCAVWLL